MALPDFLVVGAGVIGLSVARELKRRNPGARITVIDRHPRVGAEASGRNSGVLHAGFYYSPDSLKARFTRVGNHRMTEYCLERKLPLNRCGKLVVATIEAELPRLEELYRRGLANGVELAMIDAKETRAIEPRARVFERAIWSPATATIDPQALMESLLRDARDEGIEVQLGTSFDARQHAAGFLVNAAGLGAVRIAQQFGFAKRYRMVPFKGVYLYSKEAPGALRTHLYPVPDPRFPFLGVHFTVTVDERVKIGPTARPVSWRAALMPELWPHAFEEVRKMSRRHVVARAARLATGVDVRDYTTWGTPGVRAQLYDAQKRTLEMDFVLEGDERSMHILNVVSPGLTCALSFADYVVTRLSAPETHPR